VGPDRGGLVLATYVVAIRREARLETVTAEERVRQVPGVHIKGAGNPSRVVIEASSQAVSEIETRSSWSPRSATSDLGHWGVSPQRRQASSSSRPQFLGPVVATDRSCRGQNKKSKLRQRAIRVQGILGIAGASGIF
jgi:hypothetical protein